MKGKNYFSKKGRGHKAFQLHCSVVDKSEKGYFSYILHFNLILNINIVGGSKMLWKNISANKPLINLH
jgi:hypothetical protein